ncbi:TRAP transporter substrate-binding protein [Limimaricola pyoseonensis]|uniref:TRAP-type C4-dicarboxylate transport system, substrate-binding protein n=1 Tax=Limimaricola pyoseonensis TaxID=521013 RepID=A0A1G7JHU2_9RHOB|nr:TRAP transporter substrate-binding protein [Limimaricola pyoseonensis]SDF24542.1 TRAP-type C4-dicarboxylate transport system, substrate-binding protein [Limimaricola pyoseonensis]
MSLRNLALSTVALCAALPSLLHAQEREFRLGLITPPVHVWNEEARALGETLSEMSDGRLSVATFPSGQLGSESAMLQQLQTGALDMAWLTTAEVTTRVPDMSALHAPFLVDNIADAARVLRSDEAREILDKLPRATGTVGLCYAMTGMRQLMTKEPVDSAEDLAGMRFRITPAPPIKSFFEMLGAAPAPMPLTQVYDGLANGQIDAIDMDHESIINFGYHDHASHMMETNHHLFGMVALVSGRVWAQLSDEDKALLQEASQTHCDQTIDRFVAEEDGKLAALKEIDGLTISEDMDPAFFGDIVTRWDAEWAEQTPYVQKMRDLVASF